jgi:hypothetical protein
LEQRKFIFIFIIAAALLIVSLVAVVLLIVRDGSSFLPSLIQEDPCSAENLAVGAQEIGRRVHHFEDVKFVAILTNREQLVDPILKLQDLRYEVEALDTPACASNLEKTAIDYMNSVIVYLSHHMAGLDAEQVRTEFLYSEDLLKTYQQVYAETTGETFEIPVPEVTPGG